MKRAPPPLPGRGASCPCPAQPLPPHPTQPRRRLCPLRPSAPIVQPRRPSALTGQPRRPLCPPQSPAPTAQLLELLREASPHRRGTGPTPSRTRGGLHPALLHGPPFWLTPQASLPRQVAPGQSLAAPPDRGPAAGSPPSHPPRPVRPADVPPHCGSLLGIYLQESCVCVCSAGRGN